MVTSDTRHFDSVKFRCAINYFEKTKIKKKRPGMAHLKSDDHIEKSFPRSFAFVSSI